MRTAKRLWVPLVALLAVLGSGAWMVTQQDGFAGRFGPWGGTSGPMMGGPMMGGPMMGGNPRGGWLAGDGDPVDDLAEARDRAEQFADTLAPDLRVGEVMKFSNNYYAELEEPDETLATEALVDPSTGAVQLEFGPAMMWNTRYGMMARAGAPTQVSPEQARDIAQRWADARGGLTVAKPDAFPGYYTLHTLKRGRIEGMLSVNAITGAVWYHNWHGDFQKMSEGS